MKSKLQEFKEKLDAQGMPAFPFTVADGDEQVLSTGITKREYFAAHAPLMPSGFRHEDDYPAWPAAVESADVNAANRRVYFEQCQAWETKRSAVWSVAYADALMKELAK